MALGFLLNGESASGRFQRGSILRQKILVAQSFRGLDRAAHDSVGMESLAILLHRVGPGLWLQLVINIR